MRFIFTTTLLLFFLSLQAAVIPVTDNDLQEGNVYNWTSDNTYILDGIVVLEAGGTLNIEAGTVVKGKATPSDPAQLTSVLVIARGAMIHALGTAEAPVIFTAEIDDTADGADINFADRGLWGGLVVLGEAPIATDDSTGMTPLFPADPIWLDAFSHGGQNPTDSSGVLRYVSVRHSGADLTPAEPFNGLNLGAVGSRTVIDHIEVYACADDAIFLSGGTVNLKHLTISFTSDDAVDWDLGWRGKGQYWLVLQDPQSDRCAEHDGARPDLTEGYSRPIIANATYVGPGSEVQNHAEEALFFRDRSGGIYANSIFVNFPEYAVNVEDRTDIIDSYDHLQTGNLLFNCNYWWNFGAGSSWSDLVHIEENYEDQSAALLITSMESNQNTIADPMLVNYSPSPEEFDPRLSSGSPALTAGCALDDSFFDPVSFVGAFDSETLWLQSWTGMDANDFFRYLTSTETVEAATSYEAYPNPVQDVLTVSGLAHESTIRIFSVDGQLLLEQRALNTIATVQMATLPAGVYILQIQSTSETYAQKIIKGNR